MLSNIWLARLLWISYINLQFVLEDSNWIGIFCNTLQKFAKDCIIIINLSIFCKFLDKIDGIVARIAACHAADPSSIPPGACNSESSHFVKFFLSNLFNQSNCSMRLIGPGVIDGGSVSKNGDSSANDSACSSALAFSAISV